PAVERKPAPLPPSPDALVSSRCSTRQWLAFVNWKIARGVEPAPLRSSPVASKTGRAPGAPFITIGAAALPHGLIWHAPVYLPASTTMTSPGASFTAAKSAHGDLYCCAAPTS